MSYRSVSIRDAFELELELELIGLVKPQALNVPLVASNPVVIPLLE